MSSTGRKEEFLSGSFACRGTFLICARALLSAGGALLAFRCGRLFPPASRPRLGSKKLPSFVCVLALLGKGLGRGRGAFGRGRGPKAARPPPPPVGVVGGRGVVGSCHPSSPRLSAPRCPSLGRWGAAQVAGGRVVPFMRGCCCRRAARSSRSAVGAYFRPPRARA